MVDYDRHRASLNKLTSKTERSMNDEKAIFKIQSQLETATQDYEYLNNTLKHELPIFFQLLSHLVQPILGNGYPRGIPMEIKSLQRTSRDGET